MFDNIVVETCNSILVFSAAVILQMFTYDFF